MKIHKVMVPYSDCGQIAICDAIEYQGGLWLVPHWIGTVVSRFQKPVRIVRVDKLGLQDMHGFQGCQYGVPAMTLSKAVLEGRAQPTPPIEVVESPEIEVQMSDSSHH